MDIEAVLTGLATNAATVVSDPKLTCFGYVPDSVPEPCFFTAEVDIDFTGAFARGMDELMVTCRVLASRADDKSGQALLKSYLKGSGATSLKAAIESAPTLGGACDDLMVMRIQGYRWYEHNNTQYVGAELIVKVIGTGS